MTSPVSPRTSRRRGGDDGSPRRLEALSDGVFAIVMTLLVLEIHVPDGPAGNLGTELAHLVPTLLTYALSFTVRGVLWFGHRPQVEHRSDCCASDSRMR